MAKEKGAPPAPNNNVIAMPTSACRVEKCTKKADKLSFCPEHYMWFKEGLVSKTGARPTDFDKKYQAFMSRKKAG